jgi:hypothetical protein
VPARINRDDVVQVLEDAGFRAAEYDEEQGWDPGYRAVQRGPRWVLVFHEGPGTETERLREYRGALKSSGFEVHPESLAGGSRHGLKVTRY